MHSPPACVVLVLAIATACGDGGTEAVPGAPVAVEAITPPPPVASVGDTLQLTVRVRDSAGDGVAGVDIELEVQQGDGTVSLAGGASGPLVIGETGVQGRLDASWILGPTEGDNTLRVRALASDGSPFSQIGFDVTAIPGP